MVNHLHQIIAGFPTQHNKSYMRKVYPNILYGYLQQAQRPLRPPPTPRRVIAKVVEPKYDVVYPYGVGGKWRIDNSIQSSSTFYFID